MRNAFFRLLAALMCAAGAWYLYVEPSKPVLMWVLMPIFIFLCGAFTLLGYSSTFKKIESLCVAAMGGFLLGAAKIDISDLPDDDDSSK